MSEQALYEYTSNPEQAEEYQVSRTDTAVKMSQADEVTQNGWTAVPVDAAKVLDGRPYIHKPETMLVDNVKFPSDDPIVSKVYDYAKQKLPGQTLNHSMRVFYFGEIFEFKGQIY